MYNQTEGEVDTPRTDSPVIFVLSDKLKKVHPHVENYTLYSQPDWRASTKGSVGGRGEYMVQDLNLAARAPHRKKNKVAGCLCDCFLTVINGFLLPCLVLVGPAFLLLLLYNCYNKNNLTVLDVLYHYFPFLQASLNALNETYNKTKQTIEKTKHSIENLDLLKVKTLNSSIHDVRFQESSQNLSSPRFQKQIFRPRSLDSTPTTLPPSDFIIDSEMANNSTMVDPYIECNVILLPFLVFFSICLMIIYVMCKYKICGKNKNELSEKEETG